MRVGVVTTSYPRAPGDPAGCFVAEQVAWLRARGCQVEVVAAGDGDDVVRIPAGELFYTGGAPEALERGGRAWLAALRFSGAQVAEVRRRARRWDAVIAHWLAPSAVAAALATRLPMVAVAHSGDVHVIDRLGLAGPIAGLLRWRGATISFVSRALRERLAGAVRSRGLAAWVRSMPVCPMGIDRARLAGAGGQRRGDRVVFLGRLVPIKGIDVLLDAADRMTSGPRIAIAGDGPDRDRILARVAGRSDIELVGEVRHRARDRLLADADLVVLPSVPRPDGRTEGAPRVAVEAMAAGAAVVASTTGGLAELPPDAITGVRPGDPQALAEAVDRLLRDAELRARQVAAGHRAALAHDWSAVGPKLVEPLRIFQ